MAGRIVLGGRVWWQDAAAAHAQRAAAQQAAAVPRDRRGALMTSKQGNSTAAAIPPPRRPPFRAGVPWTDPVDQVVYRIVAHVDPLGGWVSSEFLQQRWLVGPREILQLARLGLVDAVMAEGSQVRYYRIRDEAAVLRSDPVLRCALKRAKATQETTGDGCAASKTASARRARRENGRWI